jgi:4-carboxymuconolactone decarboxylase
MSIDYAEFNAQKRPGFGADGASPYYENAVLDDQELQAALMGINRQFGDLCIRVAGEVWGKPLVDQKTKALITIAIDVVNQSLNGPGTPFGAHVSMAMKQGATRAEIEEVLLFTCAYAGFNKAAGAFGALNEILGPPK